MKLLNAFLLLSSLAVASSKAIEESSENNNLPKFNLVSGFYNKKSIKLEIANSDPNAVIYYTLDGSVPTVNSTIYENPIILKNKSEEENVLSSITVKKGNVIRAMAQLSDGTLTDVVSGTYFVGLNRKEVTNNLPVVSIITDPANLFDYEKGIYVKGKRFDDWIAEDPENAKKDSYLIQGNYNYKGKESERPATIQYFPRNSNVEGFTQNLGIRIMGKATRTYVQKSFRFVNRKEYGSKSLEYDLIPGNMRSDGKGPLTKYKSFGLRNGGNDCDFARIRDNVLQNLISNRSFETQQNDFAVGFIDGEYWGLYSIYEDYSDNYIANNYDIDKNNVIIIKNNNKIEAGDENDLKLFEENLNTVFEKNMSIQENYEEGLRLFDMKEMAWQDAFNIYANVADGVLQGGNYAVWRARVPDNSVEKADGIWRPMTYDTEFSSGLYSDGSNYNEDTLGVVFDKEHWQAEKYPNRLLITFLKNKEFKNLFINALSDVRNIDFDLKRVNSTIDSMRNTLNPLMKDYYDRFGTEEFIVEEKYDRLNNQINIFKNWLNGRHSIFMEQIAKNFDLQPAVKVSITSDNFKKGSFVVNDGWKVFDKKYKGDYFRENILYITAKPSSGRTLNYWKIKNCTFANENNVNMKKSTQTTIGIYPNVGCKVTAYFN
ncbi:hypothetical protein PIROE2DRAFT_7043 [Piromyces sp. E2]|nr:hypothetical protein PIROE2DRAFT_7043 [Piromyces sp. E2]|eukprot:OUM65883.1 hypothetical protein PIROE2DRAFT_7043 [Piromyces sp. E2]